MDQETLQLSLEQAQEEEEEEECVWLKPTKPREAVALFVDTEQPYKSLILLFVIPPGTA